MYSRRVVERCSPLHKAARVVFMHQGPLAFIYRRHGEFVQSNMVQQQACISTKSTFGIYIMSLSYQAPGWTECFTAFKSEIFKDYY